MTLSLASAPPAEHVAGDTLCWRQSCADTRLGDGWTVRVVLTGPDARSATATADATDAAACLVTFAAAATADLPAGAYRWVAVATTGAGDAQERRTIARGALRILANPDAVVGAEGMSHAERALAKIEAQLEQLLASPLESYTADGATAQRRKLEDLQRERNRYRRQLWRERNGGALGPRVEMTFGGRHG